MCFLIEAVHLHITKVLWNMYLAVFLKIYTLGIIIIIINMLTHSKTILENTVKIQPQPVALDFKDLSQYSSRSK